MNNIASQKAALIRAQIRSANRFFWIAGFTVFSAVVGYASATGLGISTLVNEYVANKSIDVGFALFMAAVFAAFGYFARSGNVVVFLVGMTLYALDAILMATSKLWIGVALHAYYLFRLYSGVQYALAHKKIIAAEEEALRRDRLSNASPGQF